MASIELSAYEMQRQLRIERNKRKIEELGIALKPPKKSRVPTKALPRSTPKKRPPSFATEAVRRRSARIRCEVSHEIVDYQAEARVAEIEKARRNEEKEQESLKNGYKTVNSEGETIWRGARFGNIEGLAVGDTFGGAEYCEWAGRGRLEMSAKGIHRPMVAGIWGSASSGGCYSLVMNGGYEDDIDDGSVFTYTGSGGRDLSGNKRTAPQSRNQSWENAYNGALLQNKDNGNLVRVFRGPKLQSQYAPTVEEGYRYDGLYRCTAAWDGPGEAGFKVCKFRLERLPSQLPMSVQSSP